MFIDNFMNYMTQNVHHSLKSKAIHKKYSMQYTFTYTYVYDDFISSIRYEIQHE